MVRKNLCAPLWGKSGVERLIRETEAQVEAVARQRLEGLGREARARRVPAHAEIVDWVAENVNRHWSDVTEDVPSEAAVQLLAWVRSDEKNEETFWTKIYNKRKIVEPKDDVKVKAGKRRVSIPEKDRRMAEKIQALREVS